MQEKQLPPQEQLCGDIVLRADRLVRPNDRMNTDRDVSKGKYGTEDRLCGMDEESEDQEDTVNVDEADQGEIRGQDELDPDETDRGQHQESDGRALSPKAATEIEVNEPKEDENGEADGEEGRKAEGGCPPWPSPPPSPAEPSRRCRCVQRR